MFSTLAPTRIAQNFVANGASEVAVKASRLLVVITVSRRLDLSEGRAPLRPLISLGWAGPGLANSFSTAFSKVFFPRLCASADKTRALRQSILLAVGLITPAVVLQALAAPYHVPVLFGDGWDGIEEIVTVLCLVAIPTTVWSAAAGWLRATGRVQVEFWSTIGITAALMMNTVVFASYGLAAVATVYAIIATAGMIAASLPALFTAFGPTLVKA